MRVGIYAGASAAPPDIENEVRRFVRELALAGFAVVYGGGANGLMGVVADEAIAAGVEVIGVVPMRAEGRESAHPGLSRLEISPDRERRKERIRELADVVVAVPGASGTLEEIVESWSLARLGMHHAPCALFDTADFFRPLLDIEESMRAAGFIPAREERLLVPVRTGAEVRALVGD